MVYIRLAAGAPFRSNLTAGPLAAMHRRIDKLIAAGHRSGEFRPIWALDFLRVVKSALLVRLVFPDDLLIDPSPNADLIQSLESWICGPCLQLCGGAADQRHHVGQHLSGCKRP